MSWKATGYVKELREGLSVTDKFVLIILADYHNTDEKSTWPSITTLADDCLMTPRGVQQILARLENSGFIVKKSGCGRGNVSGYQIVGIDIEKDELETTNDGASFAVRRVHRCAEKGEQTLHSQVINPAQPTSAIRKEPKEPKSRWSRQAHPTLEEVRSYCTERQNCVDPEKWFDYYSAKGWRVGRNPMKDWKAAVRTWEKNYYGNGNGKASNARTEPRSSPARQRSERILDSLQQAYRNHVAEGTVPDGRTRKRNQ